MFSGFTLLPQRAVLMEARCGVISKIVGLLMLANAQDAQLWDFSLSLPPAENQSRGFPGSSVGGVAGTGALGPRRYELPLKVKILSVNPQKIHNDTDIIVEILVTNIGVDPIFLPAARNSVRAHADGLKGRRTLLIKTVWLSENRQRFAFTVSGATVGATTLPGSIYELKAGGAIRIRTKTSLASALAGLKTIPLMLLLEVHCSEESIADEQYMVEAISEEVTSDTAIPIAVQ